MVSLKEDVESITIVELQQEVIDLFNIFILPKFENKDKITIVKLNKELGIRNTDVFIVINEPPLENWGLAGKQKE